jgi:hypothetical protein
MSAGYIVLVKQAIDPCVIYLACNYEDGTIQALELFFRLFRVIFKTDLETYSKLVQGFLWNRASSIRKRASEGILHWLFFNSSQFSSFIHPYCSLIDTLITQCIHHCYCFLGQTINMVSINLLTEGLKEA